jgi:hypothetical protein
MVVHDYLVPLLRTKRQAPSANGFEVTSRRILTRIRAGGRGKVSVR